jgi:DNA (cytosine-5)-methyltransferase 1
MELDNVLSDLEGIGYACRAFVLPACAVDARHRRDRLWIVGRNMGDADERGIRRARASRSEGHSTQSSEGMADTDGARLQERARECGQAVLGADAVSGAGCAKRLAQSDVGGMASRLSEKLDGGLNEQMDGEKKVAAQYFSEWETLRTVWLNPELAKASPELRIRAMLYSLSSMSCDYGSASWNTEAETDKEVFNLWQRISTEPFQKAQHLFPELLERIGANQCEQAVASWLAEPAIGRIATGVNKRVDRLKGLGNSIVPQVAYEILREIRKLI